VRSHIHSATTIISGIAIPTAAKMMWNASDIAICERAANKSLTGPPAIDKMIDEFHAHA